MATYVLLIPCLSRPPGQTPSRSFKYAEEVHSLQIRRPQFITKATTYFMECHLPPPNEEFTLFKICTFLTEVVLLTLSLSSSLLHFPQQIETAANLFFSAQSSPVPAASSAPVRSSVPAPVPVPVPAVEPAAPSASVSPVAPESVSAPAPSQECSYAVQPGGKDIKVRVASPAGQLDLTVDNNTPLGLFKQDLSTKHNVGIDANEMKIMAGFPPKALPDTPEATLASLGVQRGEKLVISKGEVKTMVQGHTNGKYIPPTDKNRSFTRREMPGDNSCLFHACRYVLQNKERGEFATMRKQMSDIVLSDPTTFSTAFLGQPNASYAEWIKGSSNWGGAIELSILSVLHQTEICALDVQTKRMYRYGEDKDYTCRAFVLYSGNHYDAMALAEYGGAPDANDQVLFAKSDMSVFKKAEQFIDGEHSKFLTSGK